METINHPLEPIPYFTRNRYTRDLSHISYETNNGFLITQPDQSMSIQDIFEYSEEVFPFIQMRPDVPYGMELTDIYPNVNDDYPTPSDPTTEPEIPVNPQQPLLDTDVSPSTQNVNNENS